MIRGARLAFRIARAIAGADLGGPEPSSPAPIVRQVEDPYRCRCPECLALDVDELVEKVEELLAAQDAIDNLPSLGERLEQVHALVRRQDAFRELSAALAAIKDATDADA